MLTFKNTTLFFGLLIIALAVADIYSSVPWYIYLAVLIVYSSLLFYGSAYVASGFYMKVISHGDRSTKQISISFDDGPADNYTNSILDILGSENVPATFFCIGKAVPGRETTLRRIVSEGHIIGNHTHSHHFWFDMYGASRMEADLLEMTSNVERVTGLRPRLFRPPYGVTNPNLAKAVRSQDLVAVGWDIRSLDTIVKEPKKLLDKVMNALRPGSIILFHDTSETTFLTLKAFIQEARAKGYQFVRLDKLLNTTPYV